MMQKHINIFILCASLLLVGCKDRPKVPEQALLVSKPLSIQPDYQGVTIPANLCPTNFLVRENGDRMVARFSTRSNQTDKELSFTYGKSMQVIIDPNEWEELKQVARGGSIEVEIFVEQQGEWYAFNPFEIHVAEEEIDPYISYRLIPPSYVSYEELIIEQRDLRSFETKEIFNTRQMITQKKGHCINCHSYQNYGTENMLFHVRNDWSGTVIVSEGKASKVNLKTPQTLSAGVYPAWHPTEQLIAFSTNKTAQVFHPTHASKVEVFDAASDLILYDVKANKVTTISDETDQLECFPTWSPDGEWLYFTSARTPFDSNAKDLFAEAQQHLSDIRYDLCRKHFDRQSGTFGPTEIVYEASADSMSVTLPRISPDGRYVAFSLAPYGCFHVWHPSADIMLYDLDKKKLTPAMGINSQYSESYPSFSSNGRWLMTASRRDDGNYTRPYIAYFDKNGHCHKPFEVPQQSPLYYTLSFNSFNRPEFMKEPVKISAKQFEDVIEREAQQAQ
ncbi:MAG: hypothetical protein Q4B58_01785 [Bacteroidales bacterium]|nr:hypothetical protein [Bacteroidales bacterium]